MALTLARTFDQQRDVQQFRPLVAHCPDGLATCETTSMVRHKDDEGLIVDALHFKVGDEITDLPIYQPHLQHIALIVEVDEVLIIPPDIIPTLKLFRSDRVAARIV